MLSHPARMRELKQKWMVNILIDPLSHPARMRELKPAGRPPQFAALARRIPRECEN